MRRGSFSVEALLVISVITLVVITLLWQYHKAGRLLLVDTQDVLRYEEAFQEKIRRLILQKLHREER